MAQMDLAVQRRALAIASGDRARRIATTLWEIDPEDAEARKALGR
jgi:hypothetical protein